MRRLFVLRGVQGSGKSTLAADLLVAYPKAAVVSADKFWIDPQTNRYEFDRNRLGAAHQWTFKVFQAAVQSDTPEIILDNTNIRVSHFSNYVNFAKEYGYTVVVIHLDTPENPETLAERNVHGVPANTIQRGLAQLEPWPQEDKR